MVEGLVSIIMPSYNTGKFIAASIDSVITQTYTNWELIIVDDASTDNTDDVVKCFKNERVYFFKNDCNRGAAYCRNLALRKARGEWVAFLDSDDLWLPEKLEKQLAFMQKKGCKFSGTGRTYIDEEGNNLNKYIRSPHHVGKLGMLLYCWPGCLTAMYHFPTVGLVQIADLKKNNDYAIWLKVIKKCDFYAFDEPLAKYRVRKKSISHDSFLKLLRSHYDLFHIGEKYNPLMSLLFAGLNLVFGAWKKVWYARSIDANLVV